MNFCLGLGSAQQCVLVGTACFCGCAPHVLCFVATGALPAAAAVLGGSQCNPIAVCSDEDDGLISRMAMKL
jgi:hypothetical protein